MSGIDSSMFELFREEVKAHAGTLAAGLVMVESDADPARIEPLMRAAHSIKGAARIVGIDAAVRLAHVMEDALVAAQEGRIRLTPSDIDVLLKGADVLAGLAALTPDTLAAWDADNAAAVAALEPRLVATAAGVLPSTLAGGGKDKAARLFPSPPSFDAPRIPAEARALGPEHSMLDLFREEARASLSAIAGALASEPLPVDVVQEALRPLRGGAKLVKCMPVAATAAAVSDYLRAAREPPAPALDWVRYAVAAIADLLNTDDETFAAWAESAAPALTTIAEVFGRATAAGPAPEPRAAPRAAPLAKPQATSPPASAPDGKPAAAADGVVRVAAQSLTRLMGLAGESLVQARWLPSFSAALLKLRKRHDQTAAALGAAFNAAARGMPADRLAELVSDARREWAACRQELNETTGDFDDHAARAEDLNSRLYREVIASRMRPFGDGARGLPRLARDMARTLGKEARLVVVGEDTEVDRDILEKLESPLSHLVRNAVDHGLEPPEARAAAGKAPVGTVTLEAGHRAGMLQVTVSDDGAGIDLDRLRKKVVERALSAPEVVARMTESELLEFLFLPGFSTAGEVTEFSGRGVGLDVVQDTARKVGGNVRVTTAPGKGTAFHLQLPLTLSVIRAVIVEVAGEPYAFPHARIDRLIRVARDEVRSVEHRQFVTVDGVNVGLVMAAQLLDLPAPPPAAEKLPVVLLGDGAGEYGLVVDAFRGEQDLVVRPLDARLGKVPNLSAAAILDDGSPVLIVDVEDLLRSVDQFVQSGSLARCETRPVGAARRKRVLVVDDSITVREVERQLLVNRGYEVTVAVDGIDGWNKVRSERYDLLVSDIDMPRMGGLQLVQAVRSDDRRKDLPVIIVSYKEREEDRVRGLEVGANAYLTKSSFHDNRFLEAVVDLIGEAVGE